MSIEEIAREVVELQKRAYELGDLGGEHAALLIVQEQMKREPNAG